MFPCLSRYLRPGALILKHIRVSANISVASEHIKPQMFSSKINMTAVNLKLTCGRGAGCMVGLLWEVEDLLTGVRWGNGILTLSGCDRVVLFTVIIGIKELLKPLDEIEIVLKSAFDQFLHRNNLQGREEVKFKFNRIQCGTRLSRSKVYENSLCPHSSF